MARSFSVRASAVIGVSLRNTWPPLPTFTTSCSSCPLSGPAATFGRSTATPGGDGSGQPDGGGDERLGDAGRHGLDARRGGGGKAPERGHDAPHRAEEPDERRRARRGGEKSQPALEPRHLLRPGAVHRTLHVLDAAQLDRVLVTPRV